MKQKIVYAIYHTDTNMYYDGVGLSELSHKTKLYKRERDAELLIKNGFIPRKITFDILGKDKDIWHKDISKEEYNSIYEGVRCLRVRALVLSTF